MGALTALAFVLVIGSPDRFAKSPTVGSYVGLRPKQDRSGDRDVPLGITRAGSSLLRRLLLHGGPVPVSEPPSSPLRSWTAEDPALRSARRAVRSPHDLHNWHAALHRGRPRFALVPEHRRHLRIEIRITMLRAPTPACPRSP